MHTSSNIESSPLKIDSSANSTLPLSPGTTTITNSYFLLRRGNWCTNLAQQFYRIFRMEEFSKRKYQRKILTREPCCILLKYANCGIYYLLSLISEYIYAKHVN